MRYLYAFIGAGPATLAALSNLPRSVRQQSIVVDQGRHKGRRICPELRSKSCSSCYAANCHVTSGIGGASAVFGNKFCDFPASEGVKALMADRPRPFFAEPAATVVEYPYAPNRKVYPVSISHMDAYVEHSEHLIADVMETTAIREQFDVDDIREVTGGYSITSVDGERIVANNVVIASGRSGHHALRRWLSSLEIGYEENSPDIGIRVEVETSAVDDRFFYQNDPKFKFDFAGLGQGRTFCTCRGGMIVPVKFGSGFFADGAFAKKDTGRTNVALMGRTHETHDPSALEDWCAKANSASNNTLSLGEFSLAGLRDDQLVSSLCELIPEGPTASYQKLLRSLVATVVQNPVVRMFKAERDVGTVRVFGPAIDRYWPKVKLSQGFATAKPGVFVIGDAAGVSRGIVQAAAAGKSWAATQVNQMAKSSVA